MLFYTIILNDGKIHSCSNKCKLLQCWSIQQDQSCNGGIDGHADGIDLKEISAVESGGEETAADEELPGID